MLWGARTEPAEPPRRAAATLLGFGLGVLAYSCSRDPP